jgi:hypothetical protein
MIFIPLCNITKWSIIDGWILLYYVKSDRINGIIRIFLAIWERQGVVKV